MKKNRLQAVLFCALAKQKGNVACAAGCAIPHRRGCAFSKAKEASPARRADKRGLNPLLSITPAIGRTRLPATASKFIPHSRGKICDAKTSRHRRLAHDPGGGSATDVRLAPIVLVKATILPARLFWGAPRQGCSDPAGWAAAGNRDFTFTRAARPEGSGVIHKRGETIGFFLLCARRAGDVPHFGGKHLPAAQAMFSFI